LSRFDKNFEDQRVVSFLSPEQLKKWDDEKAKAKDFLGQKIAA
jgi:hypothetical protein